MTNRNLDSTSKLTEFAPLSPELKQSGVGNLISKLFKTSKNETPEKTHLLVQCEEGTPSPNQEGMEGRCSPQVDPPSSSDSTSMTGPHFPVDIAEGRSLPNVLKRISNLLALKSVGLQAYRDTDLKQYWMPDSVSRECYDCGERFTTFRRRHHCRICGQIFCSRCCSQEVPGKIVGCTGDLRVCTYCCKVVLSYLQSADMGADLSADLRALQEDLQSKLFGSVPSLSTTNSIPTPDSVMLPSVSCGGAGDRDENCIGSGGLSPKAYNTSTVRRKHSLGYQEERFALGRDQPVSEPVPEEDRSWALCALRDEIAHSGQGLPTQTIRVRLRVHHGVFTGSSLVDWLVSHAKAADRAQGCALGLALLEGGFLECISDNDFIDGCAVYRLVESGSGERSVGRCRIVDPPEGSNIGQDGQEPSWVKAVPHQPHDSTTTTDSESECVVSEVDHEESRSVPSSSSMYVLDLDLEQNTVHLMRPTQSSPTSSPSTSSTGEWMQQPIKDPSPSNEFLNHALLWTSQNNHAKKPVAWHQTSQLRSDNGDLQNYTALNEAFSQHERGLLTQLLNAEGLSQSWSEVVLPLVHQVTSTVHPDTTNDAEEMDIRQYIQLKKVSGGSRSECEIVNGIVCTKNVAHRSMVSHLENPRILLLNCAIVYQRVEGRLLSLEPVMMQEQAYLRHVVARIEALQPDLILVSRNVSRLAQESLRLLGVTLALNVKLSVLERVARCMQAHIVTNVDAHIGRPQLGTCKSFYLRTFKTERGISKTLMFFEGCPQPQLGCSILLRGGSHSELSRLKRVIRHVVFARYHWRLELSYLMDECAQPPNVTHDTFFEESAFSQADTGCSGLQSSGVGTTLGKRGSSQKLDCDETAKHPNLSIQSNSFTPDGTKHNKDYGDIEHSPQKLRKGSSDSHEFSAVTPRNRRINSNSDPTEVLRRATAESVSDFSDPLHQYLTLGEEAGNKDQTNNQQLAVAKMPYLNHFRKALDDTLLSFSPYLKFTVPFLETEAGRSCELHQFFPAEVFWSKQFCEADSGRSRGGTFANSEGFSHIADNDLGSLKMSPKHPFMNLKITTSVGTNDVQEILAKFRACGGRISSNNSMQLLNARAPSPVRTIEETDLDVLDPGNHQHLSVLFCSFSPLSNNAPAFCVNPWVVKMDFYGPNDIPLGNFLERYCFRTTYECPSRRCCTPMFQHTRRFVHFPGCVQVALQLVEGTGQLLTQDHILMWSCCSLCNAVSPVTPMSPDTWSLSFAKYLELRFHGDMYRLRGEDSKKGDISCCPHSLHHHHYQYFGLRNVVASFKYSPIFVWEISLPPQLVKLEWESHHLKEATDEIGQIAVAGQQVFSLVLEKLFEISSEDQGLKVQLQKDQAQFKARIDEALAVTPPTSEAEQWQLLWRLEDAVVELLKLILEAVSAWNTRLQTIDQRPRSSKTSFNFLPEAAEGEESMKHPVVHEGQVTVDVGSTQNASLPVGVVSSTQLLGMESGSEASISQEKSLSASQETQQSQQQPQGLPLQTNQRHQNQHLNRRSSSSDHEADKDKENLAALEPNEYLVINSHELPTHQASQPKSVKTILSQLLPSTPVTTPILVPQHFQEIHIMPRGSASISIAVRESQPSTIISHALASHDYRRNLDEMLLNRQTDYSPPVLAQQVQKKVLGTGERLSERDRERDPDSLNGELTQSTELRRAGVLSFLRGTPNALKDTGNIEGVVFSTGSSSGGNIASSNNSDSNTGSNASNTAIAPPSSPPPQPNATYIEVQFSDASTNFFCRIYFAEEFRKLRRLVWPSGEEGFVRSLAHCVQWAARGGKSGSTFCKSRDDRLVLKEMSRPELSHFLERAPRYFRYITQSHQERRPTLLGKILGVYRVVFKNDITGVTLRSNLLVIENLFYGREVSHRFDLKGSVRNRMVNPGSEPRGEVVLLDENLLKLTRDNPLYILSHSKTVLIQAIQKDTEFLASQSVMDYSLLVGLDETRKELVVGIIDYIRSFTWDKRLETVFKKMAGQGKAPTIVQPEEYQKRFIAAMHSYFLTAPDRWYGFGRGFEC